MFILYADKNKRTVRRREAVTSGSVNAYTVRFEFSPEWDGMERVAVFRAGKESRSVRLGEGGECSVPWEVLSSHGVLLLAGVHGTRGGEIVLPTGWVSLGAVLEGVTVGEYAQPPTPDLWEQELAGKGDALGYTSDGELGLYAGDRLLSAVPMRSGGEDGVSDHRMLTGRDAAEQHPIGAVGGLGDALKRIPGPVEALTNFDLEALLK